MRSIWNLAATISSYTITVLGVQTKAYRKVATAPLTHM